MTALMVAPLVLIRMDLKPGNRFALAVAFCVCCGRAAGFFCCAEAASRLVPGPAASTPNEPFKKFRRWVFDSIDCSSPNLNSKPAIQVIYDELKVVAP
jgi:hypothetical protein